MARTQIAFRLDAEKASQFKQQAEAEGKSLNVILETFVNAYLEGKLTEGNSELTSSDGSAIALLTERIAQLEKLLTPVTELLTLNQPRATVTTKLASANTESRANFGFTANNKVTSANSKNDVSNELTSVSTNDEVISVSSELTDVSTKTDVNTELTSVSIPEDKQTVNNQITSVNTPEDKQSVSTELTSANSGNESASVSNELTSVSTNDEVISVNSKLADVSSEDNVNHELTSGNSDHNVNSELTSISTDDELTDVSSEEESAMPTARAKLYAPEPENLEPLPKHTPSELPLESTKSIRQDNLPLSYPEAPEKKKTEGKPSDWMIPKDFADYVSGILGEEIKVKALTDKVAKTKPEAKKETENGFIFDFRGLTVERKKVSARQNHYRLIGKV